MLNRQKRATKRQQIEKKEKNIKSEGKKCQKIKGEKEQKEKKTIK